jgi:hypothetical protein
VLDSCWIRRLFFGLAVLYVLPFWVVTYIPTTDGPCHLYNAFVLNEYQNTEEYPLFQKYYEIDPRPYPNWLTHAALALVLELLPPLIAEKVLVSAYVLVFLGGAWYLAGAVRPEERWPAFLAFPFVYNHTFQYGFYNFSISLGLFFFVLGFWWRRRSGLDLAAAVKLNLLLWLCYFTHILSFVLALASIGVLWLATLRRETWRRHLLHVPALLPQIPLPLWFFGRQGTGTLPSSWSLDVLWRYFTSLEALFTFSRVQVRGARLVVLVFLILVIVTLLRRNVLWSGRRPRLVPQEADAFLLLAGLSALLYFFSPGGMAGGTLIKQRLSLYPYLFLIPWLAPRARPVRTAGVAVLAVLAALNLGYLVHWYRVLDGDIQRYLAGLEAVRPDSRLLPILFDKRASAARSDVLGHAASYAALEKGLIDWDNYEATTRLFPVHFRPGVRFLDQGIIETQPGIVPVRSYSRRVDYVYTWKMPPDVPLAYRLRNHYRLVWEKDGAALFVPTRGRPRPPRPLYASGPGAEEEPPER